MIKYIYGWGNKFGMIKCRTTDVPEFQNYEYQNSKRSVIRLFYLRIYFLLFFFQITWTLKVFDSFFKFHKFSKSLNFGNLIIFQIKKLKISQILQFHFKRKKKNSWIKKNGITSFIILIFVIRSFDNLYATQKNTISKISNLEN